MNKLTFLNLNFFFFLFVNASWYRMHAALLLSNQPQPWLVSSSEKHMYIYEQCNYSNTSKNVKELLILIQFREWCHQNQVYYPFWSFSWSKPVDCSPPRQQIPLFFPYRRIWKPGANKHPVGKLSSSGLALLPSLTCPLSSCPVRSRYSRITSLHKKIVEERQTKNDDRH